MWLQGQGPLMWTNVLAISSVYLGSTVEQYFTVTDFTYWLVHWKYVSFGPLLGRWANFYFTTYKSFYLINYLLPGAFLFNYTHFYYFTKIIEL